MSRVGCFHRSSTSDGAGDAEQRARTRSSSLVHPHHGLGRDTSQGDRQRLQAAPGALSMETGSRDILSGRNCGGILPTKNSMRRSDSRAEARSCHLHGRPPAARMRGARLAGRVRRLGSTGPSRGTLHPMEKSTPPPTRRSPARLRIIMLMAADLAFAGSRDAIDACASARRI